MLHSSAKLRPASETCLESSFFAPAQAPRLQFHTAISCPSKQLSIDNVHVLFYWQKKNGRLRELQYGRYWRRGFGKHSEWNLEFSTRWTGPKPATRSGRVIFAGSSRAGVPRSASAGGKWRAVQHHQRRPEVWQLLGPSEHPVPQPKGLPSTAAGAYQFTYPTWSEQGKSLGLQDFSPSSQDLAAVNKLRELGAIDDLMKNDDLDGAIFRAAK